MPTLILTTPTNPGTASWTDASLLPSSGWSLLGNAGTNAAVNFIGTTDAVDLVLRANNTERLRILSTGDAQFNVTNAVEIRDGKQLRLYEPAGSGTSYSSFQAPAQAANINYTLPAAQGAAASFLRNDGAGSLAWGGSLDMANSLITNIGNAGTDFTAGGGLTLAAGLTVSLGGASITGAVGVLGNTTLTGILNVTSNATVGGNFSAIGGTTSIGNTTANLTLTGIRELRVYQSGDVNYSSFSQPAIASNLAYTLPTTIPAAAGVGQLGRGVMETSSAGVMVWRQMSITPVAVTVTVNAGTSQSQSFAVTGAVAGDIVALGLPGALVNADVLYTAYVGGAGLVTLIARNVGASNFGPAIGTINFQLTRP